MMASLYHRGSSSRVKPSVISRIGCAGLLLLPQYMNRHFRRPQLHVIPRALPHESDPGEQIHHAIGMSHVDSQLLHWQLHTARLCPQRIEINEGHDDIAFICSSLAVANDLVVIDGVELQMCIRLECRIFSSYCIHA